MNIYRFIMFLVVTPMVFILVPVIAVGISIMFFFRITWREWKHCAGSTRDFWNDGIMGRHTVQERHEKQINAMLGRVRNKQREQE